MKIWAKTEEFFEGKYLVVRRDGTIPPWPHFVIGGFDPCASAALHAYAAEADTRGYDPDYVASIHELAEDFGGLSATPKAIAIADPDAPPHRKDNPAVVAMMRGDGDLSALSIPTPPQPTPGERIIAGLEAALAGDVTRVTVFRPSRPTGRWRRRYAPSRSKRMPPNNILGSPKRAERSESFERRPTPPSPSWSSPMVDDVARLIADLARRGGPVPAPMSEPGYPAYALTDYQIARLLADALEARAPEFPNPIRCDNPVANGERKEADPVTGMAPVGSASTNLARAPESGGAVAAVEAARQYGLSVTRRAQAALAQPAGRSGDEWRLPEGWVAYPDNLGATAQRRAAAKRLGSALRVGYGLTGIGEPWDLADDVVEAWRSAAPPLPAPPTGEPG